MLDRHLPDYLCQSRVIDGVTYDLLTLVSGRVYRVRPPQGSARPYVYVSDGHDIDHGQTSGPTLTHELGSYYVYVCGDPQYGFGLRNGSAPSLDMVVDTVVELLKACRQQYIPTPSSSPKMWVQCILLHDREQVTFRSVEGSEQPLIGYVIPIRSGYGRPA